MNLKHTFLVYSLVCTSVTEYPIHEELSKMLHEEMRPDYCLLATAIEDDEGDDLFWDLEEDLECGKKDSV